MFKRTSITMKRKRRFMRIMSASVVFVMCLSVSTVPGFGSSLLESILSNNISVASSGNVSGVGSSSGSSVSTNNSSSSGDNYTIIPSSVISNGLRIGAIGTQTSATPFNPNGRIPSTPSFLPNITITIDTQTTATSSPHQSTATDQFVESNSVFQESQNFANNPDSANFVPSEPSGNSSITPSASNEVSPNSNSSSVSTSGSSTVKSSTPVDPIKTSAVSDNPSSPNTAQTHSNNTNTDSDNPHTSTNGAQNANDVNSNATQPDSSDKETGSNSTLSESKTKSGEATSRITLCTNLQDFDGIFLFSFVLDDIIDVNDTDWFRNAVIWSYQNGIMQGTSSSTFSPNAPLTTAMVISALASIQNINLSAYSSGNDAWFSAACTWAEQSVLFDEIGEIYPEKLIDRGQMALILARLLDSLDANLEITDASIVFTDRMLMSDKENEVFQLLYSLGIFLGKGDLRMAPREPLTRAELAFIMYNIRDYCKNVSCDVSSRRAQTSAIYHRYAR